VAALDAARHVEDVGERPLVAAVEDLFLVGKVVVEAPLG
jgi:hypothetical protein